MDHSNAYESIKVKSVKGRYLYRDTLLPFLDHIRSSFKVEIAGKSVNGNPIEKITLGTGPIKILMWSQMHGNESTTTKAVLDVINASYKGFADSGVLFKRLTLVMIPILNPDGAELYTRENANKVDLNRDAQARTQPESKVLRQVYDEFSPDFCFNLHDQRTIFSAGPGPNPATLSFLSPAADASRDVTDSRLVAMKVISRMKRELQKDIPNQIGRYDDAFNSNCVGDTFQMLGTPTILVEAGHFPEDYEREQTRKYVFKALWTALGSIAFSQYQDETEEEYLTIPENEKKFFDILVHNAHLLRAETGKSYSAGLLFKEKLSSDQINFALCIEKEGLLRDNYGHITYDCSVEEEFKAITKQEEIMRLFRRA